MSHLMQDWQRRFWGKIRGHAEGWYLSPDREEQIKVDKRATKHLRRTVKRNPRRCAKK